MKHIRAILILAAMFILNSYPVYSQSPQWSWTEQAGGSGGDGGYGIAVDGSGNNLVTGDFEGSATFGDTTLTSAGSADIFIAKYDGNGNLLWAEQAGGSGLDVGLGIAVDGSGNSLVTGYFSSSATFGDTTLVSAGGVDIFIAKYDGNGYLLWAEQAGGGNYVVGHGIAADGSGNSLVTGFFLGSATFGDTTLTNAGVYDIFIAKYDGNGNLLWAEQAGGSLYDFGHDITIDGSGNSLVTGYFEGSATFGDTILTSLGSRDVFIAKYDENGNLLWAEQAGGSGAEGRDIAVDGSGNSLVTGYFEGSATFGDTTLTVSGFENIFIVKYGGNGNFLWAEQVAAPNDANFGNGIAVDGSGNSIVTGSFVSNATFGDTTLTSAGGVDIFIAKYDGNGNLLWAEQAGGGIDGDGGFSIAVDGSGNSFVTGGFGGSATFGGTTLTSAGQVDIFIAKIENVTTGLSPTTTYIPTVSRLYQNYPNPFNPTTAIRFSLPEAAQVKLTVYDISGREVRNLVSGSLQAGVHDIQWNATNNNGARVASGIYIYRLQAGSFVQNRKMTLLR